ncbi:hypothetical protein AMAG_01534 [Allomyces macrogynus ATCC 38327]|uniref:Uncharacterized protein n=1 Tax=Allomyces macrogynus (strain ATCC 38327) TaxID=578462 RepID=A0A0L0RZ12_ALLM3|nr:hypothetical protein AMAG_01534 [Allomyces macrogynus ATCC 38327]|eukprot:KNE55647.1 hypothetical protein AMAG_01534 [Allomyces macrogynus ATCC 38327]
MGWFYDPNNLSDQLRAFSLFLHFCGIIAIIVLLKECVPQAVKGRQVFWIVSMIACLFLLATSLLEIVYTLTRISQFTWLPWLRITSIGGDITVRLGTLDSYFPYATAIVWIVLLVSLGCASAVRVLKQMYGNHVPVPEDRVNARQGEQVLSFIAFLIVQLFNLAVTRREVILSFPPPVAVDIAYLIALIVSMISANTAGITHMVVTLNRFAPTVEAVIFFVFSIKQTRKLVRSNNAKSGLATSPSTSALVHGGTRASMSASATVSASALPLANVCVAAAGAPPAGKVGGESFMAADVKKPLG